MEYTLACRLAGELNVPLLNRILNPRLGGGEHSPHSPPVEEAGANALLFAHFFIAGDLESLSAVDRFVIPAMRETSEQFLGQVVIELEAIEVGRGSIDISVVVSHVATWLHDREHALGDFALWASGKLGESAISEFGKTFADRVWQRLPSHEASTPTKIGNPTHARIGNYEDVARKKAADIAKAHHCQAVPILGGFAVSKGRAYLYGYELNGKGPKYLYVTVYRDVKRPPAYRIMDEPLLVEESGMSPHL